MEKIKVADWNLCEADNRVDNMILQNDICDVNISIDTTYTVESTDNKPYDLVINPRHLKHSDMYKVFAVQINLHSKTISIDGINPLNAGKKKEEALSMLKKWFPQMENFSGQLKKYKVTINDLLAENEKLEARAKASEKGKMKDTMERAKLKSELDDLQRLVDRIPPDILAELKRQQRHTRER